ncbi:SDR family oxidoreductase [Amycolatopsis thailandensis]|uniref:SDR family oxidoreductase n=1 Tax=Amycolatopsis thailandensis TaxID=589330 RepID=UPI00365E0B6A
MIVVTGATGNIGRPLTDALVAAGEQVTTVSRHAVEAPEGGRHVVADLAEPAGLESALAGAKALFLLLSGDLHAAGADPAEIIGRAVASGVRRVVLLSTLGVATRPFGATRIAMRALEDVVRESGVDWAILRPGGFASNALWWPAVITPREQAAVLAGALGSPVRFHELTRAEAKAGMVESMPAELADDTLDILSSPSPAELRVSPAVERVLGRPPRSFAEWAARNVAAFR